MLLPNFEFQKPITPSLDILFKNADTLVKDTFFVSAKTDGIRKLILVINNRIYSVTENFSVKFVKEIEGNFHLILDCEFTNNIFIPFDVLYHETDLRNRPYKERMNILDSLDYKIFKNKITKKNIKHCKNFKDIQTFILSELDNTTPNDGIVITSGTSTYFENTKFYYSKKIEILEDVPYNKKIVKYHRIKNKKINFIIEYDLDNKKFVKVRYDKAVSNSINTFNSILLASYQK
ncbi:hypothetical protein BCR36DRAFT_311599, partial [Piromyces finnis]